jgi:protocatechuate 3,4-dioxygenase beta subunit
MPACVVRPAQAEGPFFVDERLERADIRPDPTDGSVRQGVPISLAFQVARVEAGGCTPLAGAIVDLWHCDAAGAYSDVPQAGTGGKQFLRGFQRTDQTGTARFVTVYPGWYQGRAVHVHFKIRDSSHEFTSQLYFDEALSEHIFQQEPYAARGGRMVRNSQDSLYRNGGQDLMLDVKPEGAGFAARFEIGLRM